MTTELKPSIGRYTNNGETEKILMTRFYGGRIDGVCVQLSSEHLNPYIQLTKGQAIGLAKALMEFANDTRDEANDEDW